MENIHNIQSNENSIIVKQSKLDNQNKKEIIWPRYIVTNMMEYK